MLTGEDGGAGGAANGVGAVRAVEAHAFFGDAVDAGSRGDVVKESAGVARDGVGSVVVREDKENIGPVGCG